MLDVIYVRPRQRGVATDEHQRETLSGRQKAQPVWLARHGELPRGRRGELRPRSSRQHSTPCFVVQNTALEQLPRPLLSRPLFGEELLEGWLWWHGLHSRSITSRSWPVNL